VLERLAWTQMIYGRVTAAQVHAEEGLRLALEIGLPNSACFHRAVLAWVAAVHGEQDTTLSLAAQVSETALDHGLSPHGAIAGWAVGLLHLGLGDWEQAAMRLEGLLSPASEIGNPFVARRALPDLVEAAVRADRRDLATVAATRVQHFVREGAAAWELALTARCRALLARSAGVRERWYTEALALDARDRRPLNRARTSLLLGEHLRRERRRAEARPYLRDSLDTFERVGAAPWEKRARAELRATGETARKREPASVTQLTPQQVQIAGLVAEGATNKEVAAQLFLSPRTVDYHLRRVFTKLEISSRAELIRLQWADR
jgi:DNA-binding CsgD family transcriptional regulator